MVTCVLESPTLGAADEVSWGFLSNRCRQRRGGWGWDKYHLWTMNGEGCLCCPYSDASTTPHKTQRADVSLYGRDELKHLSLSLPPSLHVCLLPILSLCLCLSLHVSLFLWVSLSVSRFVCVSLFVFVFLKCLFCVSVHHPFFLFLGFKQKKLGVTNVAPTLPGTVFVTLYTLFYSSHSATLRRGTGLREGFSPKPQVSARDGVWTPVCLACLCTEGGGG